MLRKNLLSKKGVVLLATVLFFGAISFGSVSTVRAEPACEGDFDTDGDVDGSDLALFAGDFGRTDCDSSGVYYTKAEVDSMVADLQGQIDALKTLLAGVTRAGDDITFEGVNVHIVNGSGTTDGTVDGLGNLIVGYNEIRGLEDDRSGSHNIVVGKKNNYSSYGGLIVGLENEISGQFASVSGGIFNTSSGNYSSVSGGNNNTASDYYSSVSGGAHNEASSSFSSISGGSYNTAISSGSNVSGGNNNKASSTNSSVSGGIHNTASGSFSSVSGGKYNTASGYAASVTGGGGETVIYGNNAFGNYSSVSGGQSNTASGDYNSAVGDAGKVYVDTTVVH